MMQESGSMLKEDILILIYFYYNFSDTFLRLLYQCCQTWKCVFYKH